MIGADFAEVLAAAQSGDEMAFARLWRDGNPVLLRYLRVIAPYAVEDLAAETWLQVVRGIARFEGDESAWRAWLFTTARRRAVDEARRRARRPTAVLDDMPPARLPAEGDIADLVIEGFSTRAALELLHSLPSGQAEVIALRVIAGLDTETVARMLDSTPGAVRVAAHRGLRRLAQILAGTGVTL
ncbi:MAG TPA: sigma-70 family RNA polymerase sigma factor [Streptosporangiaceae bacterium]|nr:sigma-70 family RNA polymerase sigma factor [Streptosporangiaceae bacterium]